MTYDGRVRSAEEKAIDDELLNLRAKLRKQNDDGVYQDGTTPFLSKHHFIEINNRKQNNEG